MILAPNIACIVGVFTMGFGIMASVVTNNVAALAALANGVLPLREGRPASRPSAGTGWSCPKAMRWKETLYRRRLRRPFDEPTREAISNEYLRRRHEIPLATEIHWHTEKPQFTIRSHLLSFVVDLGQETLVVDAELSLAAKMLATKANRQHAVQFIESIANDLGL